MASANGHKRRTNGTGPKPTGRPTVLDQLVTRDGGNGKPERIRRGDLVIEAITAGAMMVTAFGFAGIKPDSGHEILRSARAEHAKNKSTWRTAFLLQVESAKAAVRYRVEARVLRAVDEKGGVTAALEWLKRRYPDDWGDSILIRKSREDVIAAARAAAEQAGVEVGPVLQEALRIFDAEGGADL